MVSKNMLDAQNSSQNEKEMVRLGQSDVHISALGIGTWAWGDSLFWGYGKGTYTDTDLHQAFTTALENGINWFDTAEIYGRGRSEELLGRFVRRNQQPNYSHIDGPVIATKFMPYPWRFRQDALHEALVQSLKRLGRSQVDLYQIHSPLPPRSVETWADALADAVEAKLTRTVGVSNYSTEQTRRTFTALARRNIHLAANQVEYSLLHRKPEDNGLLQMCRTHDITLIAYSPLGMGMLTGKYSPQNLPNGVRRWQFRADYLARLQPLIALMRRIGERHDGKTPAQIALNWVICKGAVPIAGAKNARQAADNAGALGWRLTAEEIFALDAASRAFIEATS